MINYEWFRAKWVAVKADDPASILQPVGLSDFSKVGWEDGINASVHQREEKLFISPAINGWVLFFGDTDAILERYYKQYKKEEDPAYEHAGVDAALALMSTNFPEVLFFMSYDDNWKYAKATQGAIQRELVFSDGVYEKGEPSPLEIRLGGTAIPEFQDQRVEFKSSELPYILAGVWSVNPLEFDEPQWEWLRNSEGLLYNGVSDYMRELRDYLKNWKKGLMQAVLEEKYGIKIENLN